MSHAIFYFTSTGNSLHIAQDLARGLGDGVLTGIPGAMKNKKYTVTADTVGFVFPVYCWGLPSIVLDFVRVLNIKAKYVYAVTTYGGFPGDTLLQLADELKKKGIVLKAGFGLRFPGNYTPLYGAHPEQKQKKLFNKAALAIPGIITAIKNQKAEKIAWGPWWASAILRVTKFYDLFLAHVKDSDQKLFAQDTCDGCGICAKVCPVDNIQIKKNKPEWLHHCENCMGCLQWCPQEAIQYGKSTIGRKRYRYPTTAVKDIFAQKG